MRKRPQLLCQGWHLGSRWPRRNDRCHAAYSRSREVTLTMCAAMPSSASCSAASRTSGRTAPDAASVTAGGCGPPSPAAELATEPSSSR